MAKLVKTIKQYEGVCSQCGDSFITYLPKEEKLCYQCKTKKIVEMHNKVMSKLHRDLLNKKVIISNLSLMSCRNRNFFNFLQLTDEKGNVINIGVTQEPDYEGDINVFDIDVRTLDKVTGKYVRVEDDK
jgi:hypothetical protein